MNRALLGLKFYDSDLGNEAELSVQLIMIDTLESDLFARGLQGGFRPVRARAPSR